MPIEKLDIKDEGKEDGVFVIIDAINKQEKKIDFIMDKVEVIDYEPDIKLEGVKTLKELYKE